jgi:Zn-finger nucleic acid-binding protein
MQCPVCKDVQLVMSERQNIEIDYCPQCRGVWLDRGELDKIIERSQREETSFLEQNNAFATRGLDSPAPQPLMGTDLPSPHGEFSENRFGHSGEYSSDRHGPDHQSGHETRSNRHGGFLKRLFD